MRFFQSHLWVCRPAIICACWSLSASIVVQSWWPYNSITDHLTIVVNTSVADASSYINSYSSSYFSPLCPRGQNSFGENKLNMAHACNSVYIAVLCLCELILCLFTVFITDAASKITKYHISTCHWNVLWKTEKGGQPFEKALAMMNI